MDSNHDEMTEAELAEWHYAHREELDAEEGEEVELESSPQPSVTISFRLPGAEADAVRSAADEADLTLSEWIRQACADALDPGTPETSRRVAQAELRRATREVRALARRLDNAARRQAAPERVRNGRRARKPSSATAPNRASQEE